MTSTFAGKKILAIIALSCLLLLSSLQVVDAREIGIRLNPTVIDIHPHEDGVIEKSLSIENIGNDQVDLTISKKAFTANVDGRIFYPADENISESLKTFLDEDVVVMENDIPITSLSLAPGQKEQLDLKITIKNYQSLSEYTFSIILISNNRPDIVDEEEDSAIHSQIQMNVGSAIHVLVQGKANEDPRPLEITSFGTTNNFLQQGPVNFQASVKNRSNKYINLYGKVLITNMFGQQVGLIRIPSQIILAGSKKDFGGATDEVNQGQFPLVWQEKLLFGSYKARLTFSTLNGQETTTESSFFAFPLRTTLLVLLGLLIASFLISQVRQRVR